MDSNASPGETDQSPNSSRYWQCVNSAAVSHKLKATDGLRFQEVRQRIKIFLTADVNCYVKRKTRQTENNQNHNKVLKQRVSSSLEHKLLEVVMKDCVLHVSEHKADVLCVDGGGEVVVQWPLLLVPAFPPEAFHQKLLDVS